VSIDDLLLSDDLMVIGKDPRTKHKGGTRHTEVTSLV